MKTKLLQITGAAFLLAASILPTALAATSPSGKCCCCKAESCACDGCCEGAKPCECSGCKGECAK